MKDRVLIKGNEAVGAAAVLAGCRYFFGYPITPQNEIPEYMANELPKVGGRFIQAESEIAAINMVYGAASTGARVMTSSSSPGMALKQEGLSAIASAELPCLVVNMMRASPGLGGIQAAQSDYFQATRGGGNGDYYMPVYAPASVQEMFDLVMKGFNTADTYRTPVMILGDGMLGQMTEPVILTDPGTSPRREKPWAVTGTNGKRRPNSIHTLKMDPDDLENHIRQLFKKFDLIKQKEVMYEKVNCEHADIVAVAYGTTSRIVRNAVRICEEKGIRLGLIRPITLWPFPEAAFSSTSPETKGFLCVEMSEGQMIEDVRLAVNGRLPVDFLGRNGGNAPTPQEIVRKVMNMLGES